MQILKNKSRVLAIYFLSVLAFVAGWHIVSQILKSPLILPSPFDVAKKIVFLAEKKSFYASVFQTFLRVGKAFLVSIILGSILGFFSGVSETFKIFISFPLSFVRATPVVSLVLIAVFWFGSHNVPFFSAVLMALPIVVSSVSKGYSLCDKKMLEMANVYDFSFFQVFRFIRLPLIKPLFENAMLSVFAMTWKVVVAGEVLSLPKNALGSSLFNAQVHLETAEVFAYTFIIVALSFVLEKLLEFLLKFSRKI